MQIRTLLEHCRRFPYAEIKLIIPRKESKQKEKPKFFVLRRKSSFGEKSSLVQE